MITASDAESFDRIRELLDHIRSKNADCVDAALRDRFVSGNAMFNASPYLLRSCGLSASDALLIASIGDLCRYSDRTDYEKQPMLNTLPAAATYLVDSMFSLSEERFCLLCLDRSGRLMADVILQNGTDDTALFSLRTLLAKIVSISPAAVILSHNHPRRTLHPSREDIICTREALRALTVLAVPMLDHIIVAGRQAVSIRDNGFLPTDLWLDQAPDNALLRNWLRT